MWLWRSFTKVVRIVALKMLLERVDSVAARLIVSRDPRVADETLGRPAIIVFGDVDPFGLRHEYVMLELERR